MKYHDDSMVIGNGWSSINYDKEYDGTVFTPNGIVNVYALFPVRGEIFFTLLEFVYLGRLYMRRFDKCYTRRGIVTKAKKFVAEIVDGLEIVL